MKYYMNIFHVIKFLHNGKLAGQHSQLHGACHTYITFTDIYNNSLISVIPACLRLDRGTENTLIAECQVFL